MKSLTKTLSIKWMLLAVVTVFIFFGCQKQIDQPARQEEIASVANSNNQHGHLQQTNTFSSEVVIKWMDMQLQLMRTATGIPNNAFTRPYAYSGIALYEAVVPGMPAYQSLAGQLSGLSDLPHTEPGFAYHWPCSANAALAYMNKQMFPTTSAANKTSIDSLENALNTQYQGEVDAETINRSIAFGKAVAQKIFEWSETDGYLHASDPYTAPTGPGLWAPTNPDLLEQYKDRWHAGIRPFQTIQIFFVQLLFQRQ